MQYKRAYEKYIEFSLWEIGEINVEWQNMQKNPGVLDVKYNFEHKILKCYVYIYSIYVAIDAITSAHVY